MGRDLNQKINTVLREMNYNILWDTLLQNGVSRELHYQSELERAKAQSKKIILTPKKCNRGKKG